MFRYYVWKCVLGLAGVVGRLQRLWHRHLVYRGVLSGARSYSAHWWVSDSLMPAERDEVRRRVAVCRFAAHAFWDRHWVGKSV
jgi:hypothetical protein